MIRTVVFLTVFSFSVSPVQVKSATDSAKSYSQFIAEDWARQEKRKQRSLYDPTAIRELWQRTHQLLYNLQDMPNAADYRTEESQLKPFQEQVTNVESLDISQRLELYRGIRTITRGLALRNPLLAGKKLVFMQRRRFICQMLHEYLGYFYDYGDVAGGGIYVLEKPGESFAVRDLIKGRLPRGNYTTLTLSYDAETIYFAFAERAAKKPNFYSPERKCFHIFSLDTEGKNLRQLTKGCEDDFDPCPLPDGGLAFMSTRRACFCRCNNPWEPIPSYTLHRMDADGQHIQVLSVHETNEWHPSVLHDGRIVYIRWDYVDRSAANYHGLWVSNPDGTNPSVLFGNYTQRINACYQPKAIPGSNRIAFLAGAHHADVGGSLVIFDPAKEKLDAKSGEDDFQSIEVLTPEVCFPEAPGWPDSYFHSPWPLSENYFLVSFSFDPLPGMGSGVKKDTETGIYYFDRFGNLELLYREKGISSMYPIPLAPRPIPRRIPSTRDSQLGEEGEFILADVNRSMFAMPKDRRIQELQIYQVLPKTHNHIANQPRIGHANAESARMLLGSVPVEKDGSAYFRAPARKPIYFQAVDASGKAVQTMRSVTYLQPGERRSCVGCHETRGSVQPNMQNLLAMKRNPSKIRPGPEGTKPYSFPVLVQPVLDRHCVKCHDGKTGEGKSKLILTSASQGQFSKSYESLKPYVRWFEWGGNSITHLVTHPGRSATTESPLIKILGDAAHTEHVQLSEEEKRRIYIWLDGNAPFYGTYSQEENVAQRSGKIVPPPKLQ
jgi:hydrazine synthase alpha subunit-like protein